MTNGPIGIVLRGAGWPAIAGLTACGGAVGACGVALLRLPVGVPLLTIAFALLAGASAYSLDEPASAVVDVTPTSLAQQTAMRALALIVPLSAGLVLVAATVPHVATLPTTGVAVALVGNLLLGFTVAVVARSWIGEPGPWAASTTIFLLIGPVLLGPLARRIHTFPGGSPGVTALSSNVAWSIAGTGCVIAIALTLRRERSVRWRRGLRRRRPPHPTFCQSPTTVPSLSEK